MGYRWIDTTNGAINPTMNFNVGTAKTIQLKNPTDDTHQLVVDGPSGNQLATSGDIQSGSSSQLSFKPGMTGTVEYHCIYHPATMKGIIHVRDMSQQSQNTIDQNKTLQFMNKAVGDIAGSNLLPCL